VLRQEINWSRAYLGDSAHFIHVTVNGTRSGELINGLWREVIVPLAAVAIVKGVHDMGQTALYVQ